MISIHALREEGDQRTQVLLDMGAISIHALREEGDGDRFLLRHIAGISIHALREEGDTSTPAGKTSVSNFYPRPPRGGRPRA